MHDQQGLRVAYEEIDWKGGGLELRSPCEVLLCLLNGRCRLEVRVERVSELHTG
jgi:hypothetical protein